MSNPIADLAAASSDQIPPADPVEDQILARFPHGYGLTPFAYIFPTHYTAGLHFRSERRHETYGDFADRHDAFRALVPVARRLVAAKLKEVRRLPSPPEIPRLHRRQPWRWPDEPANRAAHAALLRELGIAPKQ